MQLGHAVTPAPPAFEARFGEITKEHGVGDGLGRGARGEGRGTEVGVRSASRTQAAVRRLWGKVASVTGVVGVVGARGGAREGTACACVSVRTGPAWSSCLLVVICAGQERLAQRGNIMDGGSAGCVRRQGSGLMSLRPAWWWAGYGKCRSLGLSLDLGGGATPSGRCGVRRLMRSAAIIAAVRRRPCLESCFVCRRHRGRCV